MSFKTKAISNTVNFKIGQEFEEKNAGGKVVKAVATFEDNTLVIVSQTEKGEIQRKLEFTETGINMVKVSCCFNFTYFLCSDNAHGIKKC